MHLRFNTLFDRINGSDHFFTDPGSQLHPRWNVKYDKNGVKDLVHIPGDDIDTYSAIQSHADSVDIHVLLKKLENGDFSALDRAAALYLDVSELPDSPIGIFQLLSDARNNFDALPLDTRAAFNNSFEQFIASYPDFVSMAAALNNVSSPDPVQAAAPDPVPEGGNE